MMEKLCFPGEYMPHGHCYFWEDDLVLLHIISDAFIALSYFAIPVFILRFMSKRNDLGNFRIVFHLFSLFILFCGTTHVFEIITVWHPVYWASGFMKAGTALVSFVTAVTISLLIKPALEIPSTVDLKKANESLKEEVERNKLLVLELEESKNLLEQKVAERTEELSKKTFQLESSLAQIEAANSRLAFKADVLRQVKNAVIAIDNDSRVTYWNAFAEILYGYTAEEAIGRSANDLIVPVRQLTASKKVMDTLNKKDYWSGEFELTKKDGTHFYAFVSNTTLYDLNGNRMGYVGISYDISERISHDRELKLAKERAENLAKSKQDFLANMSHEIRTPLNGIIGISNLLEDKTFEDQQTSNLVKMLSFSSKNLNILVNDILDLAKIESGKVDLENDEYSIENHLQLLAQNFQSICSKKGIGFSWNSNLPAELIVITDIHRLTQVLNNLLNNAIKFTLKGTVTLNSNYIAISGNKLKIKFEVVDTGIGLTPEEMTKLSEPFVQANETIARQFGGTGLGLSIVKSVLQLFGSELKIDSEKGKGSVFWFEVEVEKSDAVAIENPVKANNQDRFLGKKILYVEDNVVNQLIVKKMLTKMGATVDIAETGQEAIQMANSEYDVILMDIRLPDFDGFEVTESILEKLGVLAPPIVACSADVIAATKEKVNDSKMVGFISKPVEEEYLVKTLMLVFSKSV